MADQDNDSHILLVAENDTILAKGHAIITQLLSADEPTRAAIRREQLISVHSGGSMLSVGTAMSHIYDRAENGPAVTFPQANISEAEIQNMLNVDESMMTPYGPPNPHA